ncbi:MAG: lytic transglycosylase domain-containing protein [Gammaproteobacteria bacterium]|nr:lytic transglycosylase domain-containing protein [Gammaproteobacteria bacterium]
MAASGGDRRFGLLLTLGLLSACSDSSTPPSAPSDRYADRGMLSDLMPPYSDTLAPAPGDLSHGVPAARVSAIATRRRHVLTPLIDTIALSEHFDPALVHAVISQESSYNPTAGSPKGAAGLMQLMPATAARFGLTAAERFDAAKNIRAGIRYLKVLSRLFGGDLDLILAGYNAGEGAVLKYGRRIPPYRETQTYVRRVKGYYALYRQRARHRQTRTLMAQADERRQRLRARADQRDREPSRERSLMGAGE